MRQLLLSELTLNPSIPAEDERRLSRQAEAVWKLFCPGEVSHYQAVWTNQLVRCAVQYSARINCLRAWLRGYGLTIDLTGSDGSGNNRYEVKEFEGSNYQRLLKKKGLA